MASGAFAGGLLLTVFGATWILGHTRLRPAGY